MCTSFCVILSRVDLCNCHPNQDTELFYHHEDLTCVNTFNLSHETLKITLVLSLISGSLELVVFLFWEASVWRGSPSPFFSLLRKLVKVKGKYLLMTEF